MTEQEDQLKQEAKSLLSKLGEYLKSKLNFRLPPLLSFFITKDGKINPTLDEAMKDAAPQGFWDRVGLGDKTSLGITYWQLFLLCLLVPVLIIGRDVIIRLFTVLSDFMALIPLAIILVVIWRSFKK